MSTTENTTPLSPSGERVDKSELLGRLMSILAHDGVVTVESWNAEIEAMKEAAK